jgi:hypothetical protein
MYPRRSAAPVFIACAILACVGSALASPRDYFSAQFGRWDLSRWRIVREPRFASFGRWVQAPTDPLAIQNYVPAGTSEADLTAAKNAVGVVQMMVRDVSAGDFDAEAVTAFEGKGAPSIMFHARYDGDVTPEMGCVVIYEKGVNVWRLGADGKWSKVAAAEFAVSPGEYHRLGVHVRGDHITVQVDGKSVVRAVDRAVAGTGGVGIWGGEGICRFRSFTLRY